MSDKLPIRNLACKSENTPQEAEVRVEILNDSEWVRIPVTMCELYENKDGPSDLTRTAKVKFPVEWGGESIAQYINGFNSDSPESPYDQCRIWFYDEQDDTYQVSHYGYVGGVGTAEESGVMKMWVYDPADMMRGIPVSKTFGDPKIEQVLQFVLTGKDEAGRDVGLENRSVFDDIKVYIAGIQEVKVQKQDTSDFGGIADLLENPEVQEPNFQLDGELPIVGGFQLNVDDLIDDVYDFYFGTEVTSSVLGGQKRFQLNRNNMVDLMNWFAGQVGGKWHFEPTPHGPVLFFDNTSSSGIESPDGDFSRRLFEDSEMTQELREKGDVADYRDRDIFEKVTVLDNSALYDIKPFNSIELFGESFDPSLYQNYARDTPSGSASIRTEVFPRVKITYQPLLDRAGGMEYTAPAVESDKIDLDSAVAEAKNEFRQHLEEETEGSITLKGEPYILPYDYIKTVPVCNETYPDSNLSPITYEVNSVKHTRSVGERYKTRLGVSLVFDESDENINVEDEYIEV